MTRARPSPPFAAAVIAAACCASPVLAQTPTPSAATVQVTGTRFGDPVQEVPMSITVVSGAEIRARGATDLRTALAGVAGVSVAPGGDAGPAAAVPGLLGTREVDDLLLLIDGVPAGAAFVPTFESISLVNVERIEILRGTAPVYFGTTAFAGTINVIHLAAGQAESMLVVRAGSWGSAAASASAVLSNSGFRQSISGEFGDERYADKRTRSQRAQIAWRGATEFGGGQFRSDVNLLSLHQKPGSPTPEDENGRLTTVLPVDYNQNPANAKIHTDRGQLVLGYELPLSFGRWGSTLSYTDSHNDHIRGFIDMGDSPPPWTAATVADLEAYQQTQHLQDLFIDSHVTLQPMAGFDLTAGVNVLLGRAAVHSLRYAHKLLLDGVASVPDVEAVAPKTDIDFDDHRRFVGLYVQSRWKLSSSASVLAGLRWNDTHETRDENRLTTRSGARAITRDRQDLRRLSGSLGGQWKAFEALQGLLNAVTLHASVGNTFQPAQIDFNPAPEAKPEGGGLLKAETQRSLVTGLRADALGGQLEFDVDAFWVDFDNQPQLTTVGGTAVLRSGGRQRYKGADFEAKWRPAAGWSLSTHLDHSDVRFRDFVTDVDGLSTQLAGKQLILTPQWRAGFGIVYAPTSGWRGSLTANHTGRRWLNRLNTVETPAYTVVDASLGYTFERFTLQLSGANLGNRRDPVQTSELGEDQFYRLPARRVTVSLSVPL